MKYAIRHHRLINASQAKKGFKYRCPFCHRRVIVHQTTLTRRAFFVHVIKKNQFYNPAETSEHLKGKRQLFKFFKPVFKNIRIERFLRSINQWPDLMFDHTAIEFQCSPISIKRLNERIKGYSKLGIKSWWILGNPYYQRHLRSSYLARFINYSRRLGFFILFWRVKSNCLEIRYQIRERGSRIVYQKRRFYKYRNLRSFVLTLRMHQPLITNYDFNRAVRSEISLYQKRMFHGDSQLMNLQSEIDPFHNSLMGCPLVCHLPVYTFPIFGRRALMWRIRILILLKDHVDLDEVYRIANEKFKFPLTFCQIKNISIFYQIAFYEYIKRLCQLRYLELKNNGKKITRFKEPRWFNSCYDKFTFLKKRL